MDVRMMEQQFHMMIAKHFSQLQPQLESAVTEACQNFDFKAEIKAEIDRQLRYAIKDQVQRGLASLKSEAITKMLQDMFSSLERG
jgi:pentose-5-phosphate-3-epimerase